MHFLIFSVALNVEEDKMLPELRPLRAPGSFNIAVVFKGCRRVIRLWDLMHLHGVKAQARTLCFYCHGTGLEGFTALISCNELDEDYRISQINCVYRQMLSL